MKLLNRKAKAPKDIKSIIFLKFFMLYISVYLLNKIDQAMNFEIILTQNSSSINSMTTHLQQVAWELFYINTNFRFLTK